MSTTEQKLHTMASMRSLFSYQDLLHEVESTGALNTICIMAAGIGLLIWLVSALKHVIRGRGEEYIMEIYIGFIKLLIISIFFFTPSLYKLIVFGVCESFEGITTFVFKDVTQTFANDLRMFLYGVKQQAVTGGIDLFAIVFKKVVIEQFLVSLIITVMTIIIYVYVNYGTVLVVFCFLLGPFAAALNSIIPGILMRWVSFLIGAASVQFFVGIVLMSIQRMSLINSMTEVVNGNGAIMKLVLLGFIVITVLPSAMMMHGYLIGVSVVDAPGIIFRSVQLVIGNIKGWVSLKILKKIIAKG